MKVSQKLEYACRALAALAASYDGKTLTRLEHLAQREAVSSSFLVQILNDLRRAGLIDSRRGASGGYLLARPPVSISLREIVDAIDPTQLHSAPTHGGDSGPDVHRTWQKVSAQISETLSAVTLQDFLPVSNVQDFHI